MRTVATTSLLVLLLAGSGCVDLDGFLHNAIHCSVVGPATCEDPGDPWARICKACDEPYDWGRDHPWFAGTWARAATGVRRFSVDTGDGDGVLDGYLLPAHGEEPRLAGTTILYFHGNYAGIEHYQPRLRFLHELGYTVVAFDYRGYGKSQPATTPTGAQFFDDSERVHEALAGLGVDLARLVYYGVSLGGQPCMDLAMRRPPCAQILEAPCPSVERMVQDSSLSSLPASFLATGDYDGRRKLAATRAPLFILHGTADATFSVEGSEELRAAAGGPSRLWRVKDAPHGMDLDGGIPEQVGLVEYGAQLRAFVEELAPACLGR